jgi:AcrR family transcriptional regulator
VSAVNAPGRRELAARETRRAVLTAARELFEERGWAATSITAVAERAGVSRPTVFAVGSKADLLRLVRDVALAGDDEDVPVSARPGWQRIVGESDPRRMLERFAAHVRAVGERYGALDEVLRGAAGAEPELRRLWEAGEEQRLAGAGQLVRALADRTPLRVARREAVDVVWLLMAPDQHRRLAVGRGWPAARYEAWLAQALCAQLLPPADGAGDRPAKS